MRSAHQRKHRKPITACSGIGVQWYRPCAQELAYLGPGEFLVAFWRHLDMTPEAQSQPVRRSVRER
jgi:hypothetical protein